MKKIIRNVNFGELFYWFIAVACMIFLVNTSFAQEKPGPTNTGYTGTLTPTSVGTITVDGTVIENVSTGNIKVQANNVTIRNCLIDGGLYGIQCNYGYTGLVIEDCEIRNAKSCCIYGSNFTVRRCNLHDTDGDGIKPITNCLAEYNWLHHFGKGVDAHADGVQSRDGGANMTFRYNNFDMPITVPAPYQTNAAFMMQSVNGQITNTLIEYNWMNGGNFTIQAGSMPGIIVRNNIFGRDYRYGLMTGVVIHECNTWEDTGEAIDACGPIVETPVIDPASGTYSEPVTVTISCATSGASIYYTLDGSAPTQNSLLYTAPFVVSGSTTVTAKAYASAMTESSSVSSSIVIIQGTNIALGKTVTDSSNDGNVGANVVDGDVSDASRWSASGFPQWVEIDLGASSDISGVNIYTYLARAYQYIVEASTDGVNYTQIIDRSANTSAAQPIADNVTANARYIKITVSGASGYTGTWVSLTEVMIMGDEGVIPDPVPVTSLSIAPTSLSIDEGTCSDLTETVLPANATDKTVSWGSSNTNVATVDGNGLVCGIAPGNATITVTSNENSQISASCAVTINEAPVPTEGYYCDPVNGSMSNDGSQSSPWASLEAVFAAGKTFVAGDMIYLMDGNHGFPVITGDNSADVTITKASGSNPVIERISFNGASHWILSDVEISTNGMQVPTNPPLTHPVYPIIQNSLIQISNSSSDITVDNCYVNSINDASSWSADDWNYKAWTGVYHQETDNVTISNCHFKNVNFGLHNASGTSVSNTLYTGNVIENFTGDGLRGHGVNTVIEYNTVKNAYSTNGNHVDMVQVVGTTTGLVLRGNQFYAWTDPNQPFKIGCQGIGLFDGMYYDFVIENNVIATDHYNGITLLGAQNCKIINNTVIDLNDNNLWIQISAHKDGTPSTGNIIRNNLCTNMNNAANIGSVDNNIIMPFAERNDYFTDFDGYDFSIKSTAAAVDAGSATDAPALDILKNARPAGAGYDIGAYEYNGILIDETGVTVSPTTLSIEIAETQTLTASVEPSNASYQNVTWTSSDASIAVVDANGNVTGINVGTTTITATTYHGFTDICTVTVTEPLGDFNVVRAKPITVTAEDIPTPGAKLVDGDITDANRWSADGFPQSAIIDLGDDFDLSSVQLYTYQSRAYQYTVEVSADGTNYALLVDRSSNTSTTQPITDAVNATSVRYIKIEATGASGYTGTWVSLNELVVLGQLSESIILPTDVSLDQTSVSLNEGETAQLTATVLPADATDPNVSWSTSNASVATVDNGLITAVGEGTCDITVITNANGLIDVCTVTITILPQYLIDEDFSAGASDFTIVAGGTWDVSGERYVLSNPGDAAVGLLGNMSVHNTEVIGDFELSTQIKITSTTSAWNDAAVIFNYQDVNNYYYVSLNESNDGNTKGILKVENGVTSELADITASISDDTEYTLEILKSGSNINVKLDGTLIATATDASFTNGKVGYGSKNDGGEFDNLIVTGGQAPVIVPISISIDQTIITLVESESVQLTATVLPLDATDPSVSWTTSDASIATVSDGLVSAILEGTATITATTSNGLTASCTITVNPIIIYPTSISLDLSNITLIEGETAQLTATVMPVDVTDPSISWSTSDASIATVSDGLVSAVLAGSATITATASNGLTTACTMTVNPLIIYPTSISLDQTNITLIEGETAQLSATVLPVDVTDPGVSWSTSDASIATVSDGLVSAVLEGSATITATASNGLSATCTITVDAPLPIWDVITYDDFESGWGNFKDGGGDCSLYTGGTYAYEGSSACIIQDNQGVYSSTYYENSVDLSSYSQLKIEFAFYALSMESGEDFFVEFSDDGGSTWIEIANYVTGTDFNNGQFYIVGENGDFESVIINNASYNFSSNVKLRFRCDGSNSDDQIYLDVITVTATTASAKQLTKSISAESLLSIKAYPNPCKGDLNLIIPGGEHTSLVQLIDISGKVVYVQQLPSSKSIFNLSIETSMIKKGMYILSVSQGGISHQQKLIISE